MITPLGKLRDSLEASIGLDEIATALSAFATNLGFTYTQFAWLKFAPYSSGLSERPKVIGNIPADWAERYWNRRYYEDDCVAGECLRSLLPVSWTNESQFNLTDRQRRIACEAASHGLAHGMAIPVRGPRTWLAVLTFARFSSIDPKSAEELSNAATLGAIAITAKVLGLLGQEQPEESRFNLKVAERNCILWAARGKSTAEIGQILGMPERTVYFHMTNAMDRLGVSSRVQAVAEAMKAGLIAP